MTIYDKIERCHAAIGVVRPFEGRMLEQLKDYYRIGLTWSSNAIEGNTLTISETKVVLEDGRTIGGRPLRDFYETVGHGEAYDFMFTLIDERRISLEDIRTIHRLFYRSIGEAEAGEWRKENVIVTGSEYVFPNPLEIDMQMLELEEWMRQERDKYNPIVFAGLLHLKFVSIHRWQRKNKSSADESGTNTGWVPVGDNPSCASVRILRYHPELPEQEQIRTIL